MEHNPQNRKGEGTFFSRHVAVLLSAIAAGGVLGALYAAFRRKNREADEPEKHASPEAVRGREEPTLAPMPETEQVVSPSATKEQLALAKVADALHVPCTPDELAKEYFPPLPKAGQITIGAEMPPTEQERSHLAVLAAYSRGQVTDEEALSAYRSIRKEISQPLLEEGIKLGAKIGMQRAGMTGYSAQMYAETLAKPLAERLSRVMEAGMVEKVLMYDPVLRVAQASVNYLFPERARKIDGTAMELDIAKTIGRFSALSQQQQDAPVPAR